MKLKKMIRDFTIFLCFFGVTGCSSCLGGDGILSSLGGGGGILSSLGGLGGLSSFLSKDTSLTGGKTELEAKVEKFLIQPDATIPNDANAVYGMFPINAEEP